ncbi:MAG: TlpA family protein disulfide reductase [Clostridiales bacterium]|jgi:peroxiredoxin|nr:TlpA family protein disulfide reductase [Clostridiales bacterium]
MKKYIPVLAVVIVLSIAIPVLSQLRVKGLDEGAKAPDFSLNTLDGENVSLTDLRGQVVMLNFWSAACPPCREEMPEMQQVYDELKDDGFTILAVNVNDMPQIAARFLDENGYTFPVVKDDGNVSRLYELQFIPKTLIIDRNGIIRHVRVGTISETELRSIVGKWL